MGLEADPQVANYMARSSGSSPLAVLPSSQESIAFIEGNSPQQGDILPGLCLFVQLWLMQVSGIGGAAACSLAGSAALVH